MTIKQALLTSTKKLKSKKITSASLDAEVLLSYVLKKLKEYLYTYPEKNISTKQLNNLTTLIERRAKNEPVAYLINKKEFFGLDFYVDKRVLIPRPETETLVEETIKACNNKQLAISYKPLAICDIGTGSGCIAITLAKYLPTAKIIATDISKDALIVAQKNAKKHKVFSKIKFLSGDLLKPIKNKKNDIIIANLPYVQSQKILKYEPKIALAGGKDGLEIYRKFFEQLKDFNLKNLTVLIEIDPSQKRKLERLILKLLPQSKIKTKKDLAGLTRLMIIKSSNFS